MNKRYVLMNYTIQCHDQLSGKTGCFLFDLKGYERTGLFYAVSPVFPDLNQLYKGTTEQERQSCYVEYPKVNS